MADTYSTADGYGSIGAVSGSSIGDYRGPSDPGQVKYTTAQPYHVPSAGLSSDALGDYAERFIRRSVERFKGVGREQYDRGDRQKFQDMSMSELLNETIDELQDVANYAVMLAYRVEEIKRKMSGDA